MNSELGEAIVLCFAAAGFYVLEHYIKAPFIYFFSD